MAKTSRPDIMPVIDTAPFRTDNIAVYWSYIEQMSRLSLFTEKAPCGLYFDFMIPLSLYGILTVHIYLQDSSIGSYCNLQSYFAIISMLL